MRLGKWRRRLLRIGVFILAVAMPPTLVGVTNAISYKNTLYEMAADTAVPAELRDTKPPVHDPAKRTVVILLGNLGANVGDALNPYETFAATGAFNVYTVAPERRRVPLLGGLDIVPDLSLAELDSQLAGKAPDVVVVPQTPQPDQPVNAPVREWLARQAGHGSLVLGVCIGVELVAAAGLLDGRDATSHWYRLGALEEAYPGVGWRRGTRYVDDDIITTGGVLSGIDGSLRVIERMLGTSAATAAAAAVGWRHYSPGAPAPLPESTFGLRDTVAGVNLTFRPRPTIGVVLTDGVGEVELASIFCTYTEAAYAARTVALGAGSTAPVRSRHGLVFVPRGDAFAERGLDRLIVPGAGAAVTKRADLDARARRSLGLVPEYPHAQPGFAFDAALRDMARTVDVPTARWRAKTLEYPPSDLKGVTGPGWPWWALLLPLLYGLGGVACVGAVWWAVGALRRRRGGRAERTAEVTREAVEAVP
ncbi:DJ-1/PfpI family protein [Dactylosporangium sp. NBC_01737]|uniref:DJ-1/PfpI family protein n=1 Tax=Dactylosporangium sp. NBC_01737 TaxID=2975959 RepID=UPI002E0F5E22|nr:DJ-1/PfpI family protein [Dactylosporangium sp. NBC_01737]